MCNCVTQVGILKGFWCFKVACSLLILYASFHKCTVVTQECCLESNQSVSLCMRLPSTKYSAVYGDSMTQDPDREHRLWSQHSFIHSIGMCRMQWFLAVLRNIFHSSLLYTLSFHRFPPTSLPSSLTSSCYLFLGLPLSLVASKFIHNTFSGILFSSILGTHAQINVIYLTLRTV